MLMQFEPFRGELDRLAEQIMSGARAPRPVPMDAYRRGDEFVVFFRPAGRGPADDRPHGRAEHLDNQGKPAFEGREGDQVVAAERPHGEFTRQLFLGDTLDAERLEATYAIGVCTSRWLRRPSPARCRSPQAPTCG